MLLLAGIGVPPSEFARLHPDLADALADRALALREAEQESHGQTVQYVGEHIAAVVKSIGSLQRQMRAVQDTIARRPSL